jgi:thymidylate synthase (FAD)
LFPLADNIGFIGLVDAMASGSAGLKVVNAARISYNREKQRMSAKDRGLARYLWVHGHTSPYRHTFYTFHWKAPLFVFRQAWKYQVGGVWREYELAGGEPISAEAYDILVDTDKGCSWNEISGRYVALKDDFYVPRTFRGNPPHGNKQTSSMDALPAGFDHAHERSLMQEECQRTYKLYRDRLNRGVAKEIARTLLPQSIYTQAYWTVSLQGVIHFLEQRMKMDAQHEIRAYANSIYSLLEDDLNEIGVDRDLLQAKDKL